MRVTELLTSVGIIDARWFTDAGRDRGTAVHCAIELECLGTLDPDSVHPTIAPYLASWRNWAAAYGYRPESMECEVRHPSGYVGHPDGIGTVDGERCVVEVKSGAPAAWHRLQAALYAEAARISRAVVVYVTDDGQPARSVPVERSDFAAAQGLAAFVGWKKKNGVD